jgi:fructose-bisphosphate aldolase, class II
MLIPLTTALRTAAPGAVGSFNLLDLDMAQALVAAAENRQRPLVLGVATRHWQAINAPLLAPVLRTLAERCTQPIALHLDHAGPGQFDLIRAALDAGFTSIMFDGSSLSLRENIRLSAEVVNLARSYGASVEGELGGIAGEEGVADTTGPATRLANTDPVEASRYARDSGVDALAIACGTAHGIYAAAPEISFETIRAVRAVTQLPLVLHGSTGVRPEDLRRCVSLGIAKVNFFSGLLAAAMDRTRATAHALGYDYLKLKQSVAADWQRLATDQIDLFSTSA